MSSAAHRTTFSPANKMGSCSVAEQLDQQPGEHHDQALLLLTHQCISKHPSSRPQINLQLTHPLLLSLSAPTPPHPHATFSGES